MANYGKLVWTDRQSRNTSVWKTALLLLTVIFLMNTIREFVVSYRIDLFGAGMYFILTAVCGLSYVYYSFEPDRMGFRTRIHEKGIHASAYPKEGSGLKSVEMFFQWKGIKSINIPLAKFSEKTWVNIEYGKETYSIGVEKKTEFKDVCGSYKKKVEDSN